MTAEHRGSPEGHRTLIRHAAEDWERQRTWHLGLGGGPAGYLDLAARSVEAWARQLEPPAQRVARAA